jgi:ATP-dependent Clp protease adapter protein ClpS
MVVAQVMDELNSMKNGTIRKRELKKALLTFNDEYQAEFYVDSIVQEVFKDNVTLDRSIIRRKMNKNLDVQDSVTAEPIPD